MHLIKRQTQNNFVYGELGRTSLKTMRANNVIKYWLKFVYLSIVKYVKVAYNVLYRDL